MQNPAQDVEGVVKGLVEAKTAEEQKTCIQRYFSPDASFDHPLCSVVSSPNVSIRYPQSEFKAVKRNQQQGRIRGASMKMIEHVASSSSC